MLLARSSLAFQTILFSTPPSTHPVSTPPSTPLQIVPWNPPPNTTGRSLNGLDLLQFYPGSTLTLPPLPPPEKRGLWTMILNSHTPPPLSASLGIKSFSEEILNFEIWTMYVTCWRLPLPPPPISVERKPDLIKTKISKFRASMPRRSNQFPLPLPLPLPPPLPPSPFHALRPRTLLIYYGR